MIASVLCELVILSMFSGGFDKALCASRIPRKTPTTGSGN